MNIRDKIIAEFIKLLEEVKKTGGSMGKQAKKIDLKQLYKIIYERGAISKTEIADFCGISLTAISDYTNQLEELGLILSGQKGTSSGGRRPLLYEVNTDHWYIIGIDLRATHFYIFASDLKAQVVQSQVVQIADSAYQTYLTRLTSAVEDMKMVLSLSREKILAVEYPSWRHRLRQSSDRSLQ